MSTTTPTAPWSHQLRSYIAPAAPATRTPCDGTESAMRVEFGFTPRWYHVHCGVDFSARWHTDAVYRRESQVRMREELNRRFPGLELGGPKPGHIRGSLDGVHGALIMALLFGIPAAYYPDNWPAAQHVPLSREAVAALDVPRFENNRAFAQVVEQMDVLEREYGRIDGYLNWQGVLNTAYRLRGQDIYMDLMEEPGLTQHLFGVIAETMIAGMRFVYARQAATGVDIRHASVSNCLVNMVSGDMYREALFPHDTHLAASFEHFGIHNCAWNVDPYIETYAQVEKLGYVDMGIDSDLPRARRLCPRARRAVMYKPTDLVNNSLAALRRDLEHIRRTLSPCDIVMADIDAGTPDDRVLDFARLAAETLVIAPDPVEAGVHAEPVS